MKLTTAELEFLSAWAQEEKMPDPYSLPAHLLQAANQVSSVTLIRAIKAWARSEGRRDEDIFHLGSSLKPMWPWASAYVSQKRLEEIVAAPADVHKVH